MKFAIFAFILLSGAIACQSQTTIDVCIQDLKNDQTLYNQLSAAINSKKVLDILQSVSAVQPMVQKTLDDCKQITKDEILAYIYGKLNEKQKECLSTVLGTTFSATQVYQDIKSNNWNAFFQDLPSLADNLKTSEETCKGAF